MHRGTPGHMQLPHRLQGQKVKSQGGAGAYCGGHLAAQLVTTCTVCETSVLESIPQFPRVARCCHVANNLTSFAGDKQTNRQTAGQHHRVKPSHMRVEASSFRVQRQLQCHIKYEVGTLAVYRWAVTFGTARRGLGGATARSGPSSLY